METEETRREEDPNRIVNPAPGTDMALRNVKTRGPQPENSMLCMVIDPLLILQFQVGYPISVFPANLYDNLWFS